MASLGVGGAEPTSRSEGASILKIPRGDNATADTLDGSRRERSSTLSRRTLRWILRPTAPDAVDPHSWTPVFVPALCQLGPFLRSQQPSYQKSPVCSAPSHCCRRTRPR